MTLSQKMLILSAVACRRTDGTAVNAHKNPVCTFVYAVVCTWQFFKSGKNLKKMLTEGILLRYNIGTQGLPA